MMWPGRRRRFKRGMMKYVILKLLEADDRHGYDLIRHFAERGWGRLGAGTLYPVLALLEHHGYIEGREEDGKRTYRITDAGRARLRDVAVDLEGELEDEEQAETPHDELREALHRLSGAVMQASNAAGPGAIGQIAGRLDAARKEIYTILANE